MMTSYLDISAADAADLFRRGEAGMAVSILDYDPDEDRAVPTGRIRVSAVYENDDGVTFGGVLRGVNGEQRTVEWVPSNQDVRVYLS